MVGPQEIQLSAALFKHVGPAQLLCRVHQSLLHAGRVDVGVADRSEQQRHGSGHHRGSHASSTERATATVEGGASHARAVGDDVRLHSTVPSWKLLHT